MKVLVIECSAEEKDLLLADLYERGTAGVIEEDLPGGRAELRAFFGAEFPADDFAGYSPVWEDADETNWAQQIMTDWEPIEVGERFFLVPDWRDDPTPAGRIRLDVRPGVALGTGYHATTQMCLEAMERYLRPGARFLDLGCGSGILSYAAWLLGEREIIATDIDPQATEAAEANLKRWGVPAKLITGSTEAVADGACDFVVANISPEAMLDLVGEITRCLPEGGFAVLSGFPPGRIEEIRGAYEREGYRCVASTYRDDWACLVVEG